MYWRCEDEVLFKKADMAVEGDRKRATYRRLYIRKNAIKPLSSRN